MASDTNIGVDATSFVGRVDELAELAALLEEGVGLVTIVGPPGIGKTRIARELARRIHAAEQPEGGTWFVDLTQARTLDAACAQVAGVLGLRLSVVSLVGTETEDTGAEILDQIGHALSVCGATLVVLDNFEQVVDAAARAVATWVAQAPSASFVVTSREALRIEAERVFELSPLRAPQGEDVAALGESDAARLLLDRARGFAVDDDNAGDVARLVHELDGIPLALELAAARLRVLGPSELFDRVRRRRLDLLSGGARDATARQATLRGALDWSWELLDARERVALCAAATFEGGFSLDAAEAVLGDGSNGEASALERLGSLCDKSLVAVDRTATHTRYHLFAAVRDYALERLEPDAAAEALRRRVAFFTRAAPEHAERVHGPDADAALRWLVVELDNLVLAIHEASRDPGAESAIARARLLLAAEPVLSVRGPHALHLGLLDAVHARADFASLPAALRAGLSLARGRALAARALMTEAGAMLELARVAAQTAQTAEAAQTAQTAEAAQTAETAEAAATAEAAEAAATAGEGAEPALLAEVLCEQGEAAQAQGRLEEARRRFEAALGRVDKERSPRLRALALRGVGLSHHGRGELDEAWVAYEEAARLMRVAGDRAGVAGLDAQIGTLRLSQGRLDEAREAFGRALAHESPLPDPVAVGLVEGNLGILEQECGRLDVARAHFERGLVRVRMGGARQLEAHMLGYLGGLHHELGDLDDAARRYEEAIAVLAAIGDDRLAGIFRACTAAVHAARDRRLAALEEIDRARELLDAIGDPGPLLALSLHEGHVDLGDARAAARANRTEDAARHRAAAEARAARARVDPALSASDDARFALRLLGMALGESMLIVRGGCIEIQPPGGETIRLENRESLRRIVTALVERRRAEGGGALTVDDLLAVGWPGERVQTEAGHNRVKVALSTLRRLGLRKVLLRHGDGYLLDPNVPLLQES